MDERTRVASIGVNKVESDGVFEAISVKRRSISGEIHRDQRELGMIGVGMVPIASYSLLLGFNRFQLLSWWMGGVHEAMAGSRCE